MSDDIAAKHLATYTRQAATFDRNRNKSLFEKAWLDAFLEHVPERGHVLDLGCGTGDPIARYLLQKGHKVTGVDAAAPMIERAQARFPDAKWVIGDIRGIELKGPYEGVVGWNSTFHLTMDEQRALIPCLCAILRPGAPIMLTIGPGAGEATGKVGGETVYHSSLALDEYQSLLKLGCCHVEKVKLDDPYCQNHSVILAIKER